MQEYKIRGDGLVTRQAVKFAKEGAHTILPKEWLNSRVVIILNGRILDIKEVKKDQEV